MHEHINYKGRDAQLVSEQENENVRFAFMTQAQVREHVPQLIMQNFDTGGKYARASHARTKSLRHTGFMKPVIPGPRKAFLYRVSRSPNEWQRCRTVDTIPGSLQKRSPKS